MTLDELKKLLDEYRFKKLQTYIAKDVYSEGFQACEKLLWPLVEALEFYGNEKNWLNITKNVDGSLESWKKKHIDDEELLKNYKWPCGATGSIRTGGKKARKALTDLEQKLKGQL